MKKSIGIVILSLSFFILLILVLSQTNLLGNSIWSISNNPKNPSQLSSFSTNPEINEDSSENAIKESPLSEIFNLQERTNSYYPIWEHFTQAEKNIYHNNFNEFYQEFREMEELGVVKWHPEEQVVIYGRGPNSDEENYHTSYPVLFNNSIYSLSSWYTDHLINFDLNGNFLREFGYRNTHYYPEAFTIDKDFIFISGHGDTSMPNKLMRYYTLNATPAPFILNNELTFSIVCGGDLV